MLVAKGDAYYAFDTQEELESLRTESEKGGDTFIYNASVRGKLKNSLSLPESDWKALLEKGESFVIRYRMPFNEDIHFDDIIRGILLLTQTHLMIKSCTSPTDADISPGNIVDDHLMEISHVIRGEEWLPSLPLHVMLYRSFGWDAPLFAHLPLLLKPDGKEN